MSGIFNKLTSSVLVAQSETQDESGSRGLWLSVSLEQDLGESGGGIICTWDTCHDDDDEVAAEVEMQTDKRFKSLDPLGRRSSSSSDSEVAIDSIQATLEPAPKPKIIYLNYIQVHRVRLTLF